MNTITPKPAVVILLGIPGSGKGTQAKRLSDDFGYVHISTGQLFRTLVADPQADPEDTEKLAAMKRGGMVSDDLVYKLAFAEMKKQFAAGRGVVLDGAIRSVAQAKRYQAFFEEQGKVAALIAIELSLTDEEGLARLMMRRVCEACGAIAAETDTDAKCARCGGELIVRADDNPDIARARLAGQGNAALQPIVVYYEAQGKLVRVDARKSIDEVGTAIAQVVGA